MSGVLLVRAGDVSRAPAAHFLVEHGIDSMSLIPDAILRTTADVLVIEGEAVLA